MPDANGVRLSSLKLNSAAVEGGEWKEHPLYKGLRFNVRSTRSTAYGAARDAALMQEAARGTSLGALDPAVATAISRRLAAEHLLLGWDGLLDDDDQPIPFSTEKALELLADPDAIVFREVLDWCVARVGTDRAAVVEQTAGN